MRVRRASRRCIQPTLGAKAESSAVETSRCGERSKKARTGVYLTKQRRRAYARHMSVPNPLPRIVEARALGGHSVWLRFADRTEGAVDLRAAIASSHVDALRDERAFAQLRVEFGTLVWPDGSDWAPEALHELLLGANEPQSRSIDGTRSDDGAQLRAMPEISRFLGIIIRMLYHEHDPPHFHAYYGEYEVSVEIHSGEVTGRFSETRTSHGARMARAS